MNKALFIEFLEVLLVPLLNEIKREENNNKKKYSR